ncbi:MAG: selenoneine synthase SenA [Rhodospirillales bacterium]|jgi:iron(II)-dependent oxidoreductase|nr:selenoneine synthase SenA [Rhodospirillales bacterium]
MTRPVSTAHLDAIMRDAHARTLELVRGLEGDQLIGPKLPIVNPPVWEFGHAAWFHEKFILRNLDGRPSFLANGDDLYDSIAIHHETRWDLPLVSLDGILEYMGRVLEAVLGRFAGRDMASPEESYLYQLTTFHEDMHTEAYTWTRQTLAYDKPDFALAKEGPGDDAGAGALPGDVEVPGGAYTLGTTEDAPFWFDNEKWAHEVTLQPFRIARAPVTNAEFAAFVDDGGYGRRQLWDDDGWKWRQEADAEHPVYWVADGPGSWGMRRFAETFPLAPHQPLIHVNWYEANAYCRWAGRRLPSEAEWEAAALGEPAPGGAALAPGKRRFPWGDEEPDGDRANLDGRAMGCIDVAARPLGDSAFGCRQMIGNVWEWTSNTFGGFPGFSPDAYKEYSEPLFAITKVLRGGCWVTRGRMISGAYRNYFGPERRDVLAGFRTCAV